MNLHIDLGQVIISGIIALIGWTVTRTLNRIDKRLDAHDRVLLNLVTRMARVDGRYDEHQEIEMT